ncbi:hypothetical protein [Azotobacter vinelandii]|uniref:hypothetical protein n=1 Tax=Azotobacter vinelandii TaxID=354 RepID=UPI00093133AE|nr:hypothetical protein [Azotobacter vinelandii]
MLIDTAAIAQRAPDRAEIDQAVAAFLAGGGKITQLEAGTPASLQPDDNAVRRARGNAASRRSPARKPTRKKHGGEDLAGFARRMLEGGI